MSRNNNQLNIRVDEEIKKAFISKARDKGTSATDLLVSFMKQYLGISSSSDEDRIKNLEEKILELEQEKERIDRLEKLLMGESRA